MEYQNLYLQVLSIPNVSSQDLDFLKCKYKDIINSTRTYNLIKTLRDLLRVLEKRDEINEDKLDILRFTKSYLQQQQPLPNNVNLAARPNPMSPEARRRIEELLCARFSGPKLRDFARYVGLQEDTIDSLDRLEPRQQVLDVITRGEANHPINWRVMLVKGLLDARRKDLMTRVVEIINTF